MGFRLGWLLRRAAMHGTTGIQEALPARRNVRRAARIFGEKVHVHMPPITRTTTPPPPPRPPTPTGPVLPWGAALALSAGCACHCLAREGPRHFILRALPHPSMDVLRQWAASCLHTHAPTHISARCVARTHRCSAVDPTTLAYPFLLSFFPPPRSQIVTHTGGGARISASSSVITNGRGTQDHRHHQEGASGGRHHRLAGILSRQGEYVRWSVMRLGGLDAYM